MSDYSYGSEDENTQELRRQRGQAFSGAIERLFPGSPLPSSLVDFDPNVFLNEAFLRADTGVGQGSASASPRLPAESAGVGVGTPASPRRATPTRVGMGSTPVRTVPSPLPTLPAGRPTSTNPTTSPRLSTAVGEGTTPVIRPGTIPSTARGRADYYRSIGKQPRSVGKQPRRTTATSTAAAKRLRAARGKPPAAGTSTTTHRSSSTRAGPSRCRGGGGGGRGGRGSRGGRRGLSQRNLQDRLRQMSNEQVQRTAGRHIAGVTTTHTVTTTYKDGRAPRVHCTSMGT